VVLLCPEVTAKMVTKYRIANACFTYSPSRLEFIKIKPVCREGLQNAFPNYYLEGVWKEIELNKKHYILTPGSGIAQSV
jgi:hypothetical protein